MIKLTLEFANTKALYEFLKEKHESVEVVTKKKKTTRKKEVKVEAKVEDIPKIENMEIPETPEDTKKVKTQREAYTELMAFFKEAQKSHSSDDLSKGIDKIKSELGVPIGLKMVDADVETLEKFLHAAKVEFIEL